MSECQTIKMLSPHHWCGRRQVPRNLLTLPGDAKKGLHSCQLLFLGQDTGVRGHVPTGLVLTNALLQMKDAFGRRLPVLAQ